MCWAQLGSAHPGSAIWLQQDRNWSWRGLKARVGWMSKVAHSCGLQLMLAIDQELSWAASWPMSTYGFSMLPGLLTAWWVGSERSSQGQAYKILVVLEAAKLLIT